MNQCLTALAAMHATGVVNGDVGPHNWLLSQHWDGPVLRCEESSVVCDFTVALIVTRPWCLLQDFMVKVADFGCSPTTSEGDGSGDELWDDWGPFEATLGPCGALHYTAPEALVGVCVLALPTLDMCWKLHPLM